MVYYVARWNVMFADDSVCICRRIGSAKDSWEALSPDLSLATRESIYTQVWYSGLTAPNELLSTPYLDLNDLVRHEIENFPDLLQKYI